MAKLDDKFPERVGRAVGASVERQMNTATQGTDGIKTKQWTMPDGSTTRLRTRLGHPEIVTYGGEEEEEVELIAGVPVSEASLWGYMDEAGFTPMSYPDEPEPGGAFIRLNPDSRRISFKYNQLSTSVPETTPPPDPYVMKEHPGNRNWRYKAKKKLVTWWSPHGSGDSLEHYGSGYPQRLGMAYPQGFPSFYPIRGHIYIDGVLAYDFPSGYVLAAAIVDDPTQGEIINILASGSGFYAAGFYQYVRRTDTLTLVNNLTALGSRRWLLLKCTGCVGFNEAGTEVAVALGTDIDDTADGFDNNYPAATMPIVARISATGITTEPQAKYLVNHQDWVGEHKTLSLKERYIVGFFYSANELQYVYLIWSIVASEDMTWHGLEYHVRNEIMRNITPYPYTPVEYSGVWEVESEYDVLPPATGALYSDWNTVYDRDEKYTVFVGPNPDAEGAQFGSRYSYVDHKEGFVETYPGETFSGETTAPSIPYHKYRSYGNILKLTSIDQAYWSGPCVNVLWVSADGDICYETSDPWSGTYDSTVVQYRSRVSGEINPPADESTIIDTPPPPGPAYLRQEFYIRGNDFIVDDSVSSGIKSYIYGNGLAQFSYAYPWAMYATRYRSFSISTSYDRLSTILTALFLDNSQNPFPVNVAVIDGKAVTVPTAWNAASPTIQALIFFSAKRDVE